MRNSFLRFFFVTALTSSLLVPIAAHAASPYDNAPADLKSYEAALLKNLAVVKYGFTYGVAFAGDYSLSQEQKDKGINSILLTTASTLNPENDSLKGCFAKGNDQKVSVIYSDRTYDGTCWSWNRDGTDFAVVATSVTLPKISLYDSYWPKVDGWLEVAYYVDGFGIQLRPSKVRIINEKLYVLGIDKISPSMKYGGLAFNSLGNFVGTVSQYGPGVVPGDYLKLNGAPLQCGWENSSATITNCSTRTNVAQSARAGVWTIDSPSAPAAATTPTPKPTVDSGANEVSDANKAVSDALSKLLEVVDACESLASGIRERLGEFQVANPLLDKCGTLDGKYAEIDSKRAQAFTGSGSTNAKVDALNKLTDQALAQVDAAELVVALLQDAQPVFDEIIPNLLKYGIDFATTAESVANLNNRVYGLPKTVQTMIIKNSNYKKLASIFPAEYDLEETISKSLPDLSAISSIAQLKNVENLIAKARSGNSIVFNSGPLLKAVEKLIPKYVCVKGKTVSVTPATGKCAPGSTKTSTS
jgi:hypothetical protein